MPSTPPPRAASDLAQGASRPTAEPTARPADGAAVPAAALVGIADALPSAPRVARLRLGHGKGLWQLAAWLPALIVLVPMFGIVAALGAGDANTRAILSHMLDTVLPEYALNSLRISLAVAVGVLAMGVSSAWLVVHYAFPRAARAGVGADSAARHAGLRHGLRLYRLPPVFRPGANGAAAGAGRRPPECVPRDPLVVRRGVGFRRGVLSVCLSTVPPGVSRP